MTIKERLHRVVDELPEGMALELEHYASYFQSLAEREEWNQFSLSCLSSRYGPDEVEYEPGDVQRRVPSASVSG